ncbi:MAG: hypothetical protein M5F18_09250, partial [Asgard group archaeon]|nr:hypothetical protein [Asgard group archaeon]
MLLLRSILLTLVFLFNYALSKDITVDTVDRGSISLSVGDINIHTGASWSIINNAVSALAGSLNVESDAGFYITLTSPLIGLDVTLLSTLGSIVNDGIIAFNSVKSLTSSTYNLVGAKFENNGEMYLGASGVLSGTMSITSLLWKNSGLLVFYQNQRNSGDVRLGTPLGSITNDGQICLINQVYRQTNDIKGSGCITAQEDSTIYIPSAIQSFDTQQSIYLKDSESSIIVQALSTAQTFNVYGFGNGNKIGLTVPLVGNLIPSYPAYKYDESTGILTLRNLLLKQNFNIGLGYSSSLFQIVTDSGIGLPSTLLGSVQYNGPVPERSISATCQIECKELPEAPGVEPTEYLTTLTSTLSDGSVTTESGIVDV